MRPAASLRHARQQWGRRYLAPAFVVGVDVVAVVVIVEGFHALLAAHRSAFAHSHRSHRHLRLMRRAREENFSSEQPFALKSQVLLLLLLLLELLVLLHLPPPRPASCVAAARGVTGALPSPNAEELRPS
jgi:hypothetical protein